VSDLVLCHKKTEADGLGTGGGQSGRQVAVLLKELCDWYSAVSTAVWSWRDDSVERELSWDRRVIIEMDLGRTAV